MSGSLGTKGTAAWNRVRNKVKNLGDLILLIRAKVPNAATTSCNLTAEILGDILDPAWLINSAMTPVHMSVQPKAVVSKGSSGFGDMMDGLKGTTKVVEAPSLRQEQRVAKVKELLDGENIVYITTSPDHHFVVFPISDSEVVILQGFQGVYNLVDWMANADQGGKFAKASLVAALGALVSDNVNERTAAAAALFGFEERGIIPEVVKYFRPATQIVAIAHKSL
jgi:hypothetical protein